MCFNGTPIIIKKVPPRSSQPQTGILAGPRTRTTNDRESTSIFRQGDPFLDSRLIGDHQQPRQVQDLQVFQQRQIRQWVPQHLVLICRIRKFKSCRMQSKKFISIAHRNHKMMPKDLLPLNRKSHAIMNRCKVRFRSCVMILSPRCNAPCQPKTRRSARPWKKSSRSSTEDPNGHSPVKRPLRKTKRCKVLSTRIRFSVQWALCCTLPKGCCTQIASFVEVRTKVLRTLFGTHCPLQHGFGGITNMIKRKGLHKQLPCQNSARTFWQNFLVRQNQNFCTVNILQQLTQSFCLVLFCFPGVSVVNTGKSQRVLWIVSQNVILCQHGPLERFRGQSRAILANNHNCVLISSTSPEFHHPFNGIRIGEAKNPGPPSEFLLKCCLINPTAIFNKTDVVRNIDSQVYQIAENSAMAAIQIAVQAELRQKGFQSHWSPPVASHAGVAQEEVSFRGQATGVSLHSMHPVRPSRVQIPSDIDATRLLSRILQIGTWKIHFVTISGYPSCHQKSKERTNTNQSVEAAAHMILICLPYFREILTIEIEELGAGQTLMRCGFVILQSKYRELYAQTMPPTCREVTSPDQVLLSQSLQSFVTAIQVDKQKDFSDHGPILYHLKLPTQPPMKSVWRLPKTWLTLNTTLKGLHSKTTCLWMTMTLTNLRQFPMLWNYGLG